MFCGADNGAHAGSSIILEMMLIITVVMMAMVNLYDLLIMLTVALIMMKMIMVRW